MYNGASMTVLQALVQFFTWFSEHPGISKEALSSLLHIQHHNILPPGTLLPTSYQAALTAIEPYFKCIMCAQGTASFSEEAMPICLAVLSVVALAIYQANEHLHGHSLTCH